MDPKDPFLGDPDRLNTQIHCISCREPLWTQKVLKRSGGHVLSTETKPVEEVVPPFSARIEKCPYCLERFYGRGKNGAHLYLIRDLNCNIMRLI